MLRYEHIARLALQHSPEKEQRLIFVSGGSDDKKIPGSVDPLREGGPGASKKPETIHGIELSQREQFHDAIFKAIQMEDQKQVLRDYKPLVEHEVGGDIGNVEAMGEADLNNVVTLTRAGIIEQLHQEEVSRQALANDLRDVDGAEISDDELFALLEKHRPTIERYIVMPQGIPPRRIVDLLQILLRRNLDKMRALEQKTPGITWKHLEAEDFEKTYRKLRKFKPKDDVRMPNAFSSGGTIYVNIDHQDFADAGLGELMANRMVMHEATHIALKLAKPNENLDVWTNTLKSHPRWKDLKAAVEATFANDAEYLKKNTNQQTANEALAMYMANKKYAAPAAGRGTPQARQVAVAEIVEDMFSNPHTGNLTTLKQSLESTVDRYTEAATRNGSEGAPPTIGAMIHTAAAERQAQAGILNDPQLGRGRNNPEDGSPIDPSPDTNPDEGLNLIQGELEEGERAKVVTPESLLSGAEKVRNKITSIENGYPRMREIIASSGMDSLRAKEMNATIDQNLEEFSMQKNDMTLIKKYASAFHDWHLSPEQGGMTAEEKAEFVDNLPSGFNPYKHIGESPSSPQTLEAADALFESQIQELMKVMNQTIVGYEAMLEKIGKEIGDAQTAADTLTGSHSQGVWQWMKTNIFSSQGHITWLTPKNIMNIIKIYKDAVVENYNSNQKVKENATAKKLNFYKPIDHTLKKLARSSNQTETSEFHEYIEKEGYTFDEVFGRDGRGLSTGLLHDNRNNFNRAKAVLEYAADHAWLYFLDPLHGHDVYGLDYETIEGHQSFEELVQKNEAGKSHQIDHGYERVDKYPDVPMIMDTMVHELRQKNIFAVQGVMKRLQDKAKYSHSNTWMLTTLLMLIRDEAPHNPALRYCLDKGMIDNISNHTIEQSAWSVTWLKMMRTPIMNWKEGREDFGNNILTSTMEKIEARLAAAGANFPDTPEGRLAKYEAIGMILAGKTYSTELTEARDRGLLMYGMRKGETISIFQSDFTDYRQAFNEYTEQASADPKKTDPDYFNVRNGGSDVMLLNRAMTFRILEKTSTGTWTFKTQAEGFIGQIVDRHEELGKLDPAAQFLFEKDIRAKVSDWWNGTDDSRKNQFFANKDQRDRVMWEEFLRRNLLDRQARHNLQKTINKNYIDGLPAFNKEAETARVKKLFADAEKLAEQRSGGN